MKRVLMLVGVLLALGACTPPDVQYCKGFGVEGTAEYGKCIDYYHQQENAFAADRNACEMQADGTYPPTLYDNGSYAHAMGGFGPYGQYYGGQTIFIEPDYQHNAQVDQLRMRIIAPCMQAQGWNSGTSWQVGRHAVTQAPSAPKAAAKLPWLK